MELHPVVEQMYYRACEKSKILNTANTKENQKACLKEVEHFELIFNAYKVAMEAHIKKAKDKFNSNIRLFENFEEEIRQLRGQV